MSFREEMDLPTSVTLSPVAGLFYGQEHWLPPSNVDHQGFLPAQLCGSKPQSLASGALQAVTVSTSYVPVSMELSL